MRIKAAIFDFDGLILDTETTLYEAWRDSYAQYGCELPRELWNANIGAEGYTGFHPMEYLREHCTVPLDEAVFQRDRKELYLGRINQQECLPGVRAALNEAKRLSLQLAVASSSSHPWVEGHLKRLGLLALFNVICCQEDVVSVKPDPALYTLALQKLDVRPGEAIVLEDSPHGIVAAQAAGLYCVAVNNPMTALLDLDFANRRLESLDEVPFTNLLTGMEDGLAAKI
jgi:HAD superfamily hydrolase (TIGR01509 family)